MLKFTYLVNFGLAGVLIVPALTQELGSVEQLESSIVRTGESIENLERLEARLSSGDYSTVREILRATEAPFGDERERSAVLDRLRDEVGRLESKVQQIEERPLLPHLLEDPTVTVPAELEAPSGAHTVGLSQETRDALENIWPPVSGGGRAVEHPGGERIALEPEDFTVDALRQGRAYYRAGRYQEALRLIGTRRGEPEADYWIGRCLERLARTKEAIAAYASVEAAVGSGPLADRAKADREFLEWLVDFGDKVRDLRGEIEVPQR